MVLVSIILMQDYFLVHSRINKGCYIYSFRMVQFVMRSYRSKYVNTHASNTCTNIALLVVDRLILPFNNRCTMRKPE